jgi:hypothetical protein
MPGSITESDYKVAANSLKCNVAAVKAVAEVESAGSGFLNSGKVKVLFEGHQFFKYTKGKFAKTHPTLCFPKWTREHYARGADAESRGNAEYARLEAAMRLDRSAALLSASYGRFQIMGFNFAVCGYSNVDAFFTAMSTGEKEQLLAFSAYIVGNSLDDELRGHHWDDFARKYNGPEYKKNRYAEKLAVAYARFLQTR